MYWNIWNFNDATILWIIKHRVLDGKVYLVYVRDLFQLFWKSAIILSNKVIRMLSTCVTEIHHLPLLIVSLPYLYVCLIRLHRLQKTYVFYGEEDQQIHEYTFYSYLESSFYFLLLEGDLVFFRIQASRLFTTKLYPSN